jgi:hypothetical protein
MTDSKRILYRALLALSRKLDADPQRAYALAQLALEDAREQVRREDVKPFQVVVHAHYAMADAAGNWKEVQP